MRGVDMRKKSAGNAGCTGQVRPIPAAFTRKENGLPKFSKRFRIAGRYRGKRPYTRRVRRGRVAEGVAGEKGLR